MYLFDMVVRDACELRWESDRNVHTTIYATLLLKDMSVYVVWADAKVIHKCMYRHM